MSYFEWKECAPNIKSQNIVRYAHICVSTSTDTNKAKFALMLFWCGNIYLIILQEFEELKNLSCRINHKIGLYDFF